MANEDRETEKWKAKFTPLLHAYLSRKNPRTRPTIEQLDKLESFLTSETEHVQHSHYLGDLEQKLPLIKKIYESLPQPNHHKNLDTARFWSGLWALEVHSLKDIEARFEAIRSEKRKVRKLQEYLKALDDAAAKYPKLLRMWKDQEKDSGGAQLGEGTPGDTASTATRKRPASTSEPSATPQKIPKKTAKETPQKTPQKTPKNTRNKAKSAEALKRDNERCIVTNMETPQVCHIIPFGLLNCEEALWPLLDAMQAWFGKEAVIKAQRILCEEDDDNIIDEPANMVCLNPHLHKWWADGRFMLKPRGPPYKEPVGDDGVATDLKTANQANPRHSMSTRRAEKQPAERFRWCQEMTFHWLRKTGFHMPDRADFNCNPRDAFQPIDHKTLGATRLEPWELVVDGQLIKVYADREADLPSYDLLQLQANLLTAFSLTAAADPKLYESDDEDMDAFSYQKQKKRLLKE
ncbi:uncharacterized protein CLUP02_01799 [Colletotrichum lupini]|uniref:HNH nuclease domain-containing protein n=1 Tax=Colletotrichum lupini TaxID=145971 RepID=A0A9Q8SDV8_9PEZI|nr:uncharacterized protein CLUP02_01799 [Colletotrichum lupini]UQC75146.1 hypothetical protein CLUP02_01799 [Colletotrichum lupini]